MKKNINRGFRFALSSFIFFFCFLYYTFAYFPTSSPFLLIISLILIIIYCFNNKIVYLLILFLLMLVYFLLYNFLPEKECTNFGSYSCDCIGIKKLLDIKGSASSCIGVRQKCYSYNPELNRREEFPCDIIYND